MRKIAIFTGTRAEYGLLYWLMKDIHNDSDLELNLIVSGTHLSPEFGNTYKQIEKDGFSIDEKVEMLLSSDTAIGVAKSMGLGIIGFTDALARLQPDVVVILGDRFEALAIAQVATVMNFPIVHLHGGEVTEGAYDDAIRHSISKLSLYHCTCTDAYRRRVIQLGESPDRVFNFGAIGLEHIRRSELMSRHDFLNNIGLNPEKPFFMVTYHPVTLANESATQSVDAMFKAIEQFNEHQVVISYPNADHGGRKIISMIDDYVQKNSQKAKAFASLGQLRYLSALKHCSAVIGNSSSGIAEAPYFNNGTINIGSRQQGRLCPDSVIHCDPVMASIKDAITLALSEKFRIQCSQAERMFGDGNTSGKIIKLLKNCELNTVKTFYDIDMRGK